MKGFLVFCAIVVCTFAVDCDNIRPEVKAFVDNGIRDNEVFFLSLSYCKWCKLARTYVKKMGYKDSDVSYNNIDTMAHVGELADYAKCLTGERSFPRVWINHKFVGGSVDTRMAYFTGSGIKSGYQARVIPYFTYRQGLTEAAKEYVDTSVADTANGGVFLFSKRICPHCMDAKACLKKVGKQYDVVEINDFATHDAIKAYKKVLTGSPYTPLIGYNGEVLMSVEELKEKLGC